MELRLGTIVKRVEDAKISVLVFAILLSSIIFIRVMIENEVSFPVGQRVLTLPFVNLCFAFYLSAFLSATLLVNLISNGKIERTSKILLVGYVAIVLPPIIDYLRSKVVFYEFIFDPRMPLSTPNWGYLLRAYLTFGSGVYGVMPGIQIEVLIYLILSTLYVYSKTKSTIRTLVTPLAVYSLTFFYASFPNYFSFGTLYEIFNAFHNDLYFSSVFAILIAVQSGLWLLLWDKRKFLSLFKSLKTERSLHYAAMAGFGAFLGGVGLYPAFLAVVCVLLLWLSTTAINDITDVAADRISLKASPLVEGVMSESEMAAVAIYCGLLALLFAEMLGFWSMTFAASAIAIAIFYSVPPVRLRKYPILSTLMLAFGALFAFTIGFYSNPTRVLFPNNLALAIIICFTLAFNTKDLKDYVGDKSNGIWTIPVIFGPKKGRVIVAVLDLAAFLLVPVILRTTALLIPAAIFGVLTFLAVLRKETKERTIFLLYFLFLSVVFFIIYI
jgi:homogentisate phytyltransferase/homogentisate geranylgeranyltransferase